MMRIGHEGLRPYFEQLWEWNQLEQEEGFRTHFEPEAISIIQVDGCDVGYFKIESHPDHIFLAGIYIDSNHRRLGLGTNVLSDIVDRYHEVLPIRLRVLKPNPSQYLYRRLGFRVLEETPTHLVMELAETAEQIGSPNEKQRDKPAVS